MKKIFLTLTILISININAEVKIHELDIKNNSNIEKSIKFENFKELTNDEKKQIKEKILQLPPEESFLEIKKTESYFINSQEIKDFEYENQE